MNRILSLFIWINANGFQTYAVIYRCKLASSIPYFCNIYLYLFPWELLYCNGDIQIFHDALQLI